MLEHLKEIKEKLYQLIQDVEKLENDLKNLTLQTSKEEYKSLENYSIVHFQNP